MVAADVQVIEDYAINASGRWIPAMRPHGSAEAGLNSNLEGWTICAG